MLNLVEQKISIVSHSLSFFPLNLEKKNKKKERGYVTTWPFYMTHHDCPHMEGFIFVSVTVLVSWYLFLKKTEFLTVLRFCLSWNTWARFLFTRLWNTTLRPASDLCWVQLFLLRDKTNAVMWNTKLMHLCGLQDLNEYR